MKSRNRIQLHRLRHLKRQSLGIQLDTHPYMDTSPTGASALDTGSSQTSKKVDQPVKCVIGQQESKRLLQKMLNFYKVQKGFGQMALPF